MALRWESPNVGLLPSQSFLTFNLLSVHPSPPVR